MAVYMLSVFSTVNVTKEYFFCCLKRKIIIQSLFSVKITYTNIKCIRFYIKRSIWFNTLFKTIKKYKVTYHPE